jgi:hypothetical protein
MDALDLESLDYSRVVLGENDPRKSRSCRRKIYLQNLTSGDVYSIVTTCGSNRCDDCGPRYRQKHVAWLATCFEPHDQLSFGRVQKGDWESAKRWLQRQPAHYVWVKSANGSLSVFATADFTREGVRCVAVSQRTALVVILQKLRRPAGLAPKRALVASRSWSKERPRREESQSRPLGTARLEATEAKLKEVASELHLERGGRWPEGAARPPDLTPDDYGNLFGEAIDEDWRRFLGRE